MCVKEKDTHILQTPTTAIFVCTDYSVHSLVQLISIPHSRSTKALGVVKHRHTAGDLWESMLDRSMLVSLFPRLFPFVFLVTY